MSVEEPNPNFAFTPESRGKHEQRMWSEDELRALIADATKVSGREIADAIQRLDRARHF